MIEQGYKRQITTVICLLFLTLCSGAILVSHIVSASDVIDDFSININVSCTLFNNVGTAHTAEVPNGTYETDIGTTTIKAYCNDTNGFSIYAIGYTGEEYGNNTLVGTNNSSSTIATGTAVSGDTSNWAMKLEAVSGTYTPTITNSFNNYHIVPDTYTKVATYASATDIGEAMNSANGSSIHTTYAAYVSYTQPADTYVGKVKYTLVHPNDAEAPATPITTIGGCIKYYPNASDAVGTMGCHVVDDSDTYKQLFASNYSRNGYGFVGWSDVPDYRTNPNAHFYGPNDIIYFETGQYNTPNSGLSLYAMWVPSAGSMQSNAISICNGLTAATNGLKSLDSVSALTDQRDNQTYAIAKLADGKCWMIENLRLDSGAQLTLANTNNPLNDGTDVTLKHIYSDTQTYNTLSPSSTEAYDATSAPYGWCANLTAECMDQSRIRTDNVTNRTTYTSDQIMSYNTTYNDNIYAYGGYYNWYSATAGRGTRSFSTNNDSVSGDICPAGWRLPRSGDKTRIESNDDNDFWNLVVDALNNGTLPANYSSSTTPNYSYSEATPIVNAIRSYPNNFVWAGSVGGNPNSIHSRSINFAYTTSTVEKSSYNYYFSASTDSVSPSSHVNKYYGLPIRCIVSGL